jgi:hypothetical protein
MDVEEIYLQPPEGDDSDGYDVSDTEEGDAVKISRTILQAEVAEVRTGLGDIVLEDLLGQQPDDRGLPDELPDELPDLEPEAMTAPKRIKRAVRNEYYWEDRSRNIASKDPAIFPEPNYTVFRGLSPKGLYDLFFTSELLDRVAELSNQYAMSKFGLSSNISGEEINIFIGILLLSGYNPVTDYEMYWSISEDCENRLVKSAMSRDRFRTIKRCFHLGSKEDRDGEVPDRYKKVRFLISHMQQQFASLFVPEQNLSHDEAMIKYFGKSGLKQAIRNKPIRFGFKAWCLCTVSGYVVVFDLYQGKGVGLSKAENVAAVGAAGATLLDLVDLLPEEKRNLPYHFFGDNFFSSLKLVDELAAGNYFYTGTIRKDRLKGRPPLTEVEAFKKKERGYHEAAVLQDQSQIVVRWNDNAPVTMVSNILGTEPIATCSRYSRTAKKYVDVPQPDIVRKYNASMGGVDRFDQNNNHLRIRIGGKKWYWTIVTWLLDTSLQNAWQLHKKVGGSLTYLNFRREVVCVVLKAGAEVRKRNTSGSSSGSGGKLSTPGAEEIRFDCVGHFVVVRRNIRKTCSLEGCKTKCQTFCEKCNRAVCADHFKEYHVGTLA